MPVSKQIELRAKKDIVDGINNVIDRWLKDGLTINKDQNLTPSMYKQRPTYINSLFSYFN